MECTPYRKSSSAINSAADFTAASTGGERPGFTMSHVFATWQASTTTSMPQWSRSSRSRFEVGIWCMEKSSSLTFGRESTLSRKSSPGSLPQSIASTMTIFIGFFSDKMVSNRISRTEVPALSTQMSAGIVELSRSLCATAGPKPSSPSRTLPHPRIRTDLSYHSGPIYCKSFCVPRASYCNLENAARRTNMFTNWLSCRLLCRRSLESLS
jgi:hypothetical protein